VEVTEKESVLSTMPNAVSKDGGMLLGLKDAGTALGVSYSTIYELVNKGDLEHVSIGSCRYIAREALLHFIEKNTYRGFHR
jgi:excisionase family DNA binding protein